MLDFKTRHRLSRFNDAPPSSSSELSTTHRQRVLVTEDDATLALDGASGKSLDAALAAARDLFPRAQVILLRARSGFRHRIGPTAIKPDIVLEPPADIVDLVSRVDAVVASSSLVGLEAVLLGRTVVCLEPSIYGGWGLTIDEGVHCGERRHPRNVEELFAAAYILCSRYVDPLTNEACSPELAFERLAAFRRHADRVAGSWYGRGLPPPKHALIAKFLAGPTSTYSPAWPLKPACEGSVVTWATARGRMPGARDLTSAVKVEDGFIRSVGLGSNLHPAGSIVLDRQGIYYDPSAVSDLEDLLNHAKFSVDLLRRARLLRHMIVANGLSKYNLARTGAPPRPPPAKGQVSILVPGQVEDDASVQTGGGGRSNLWLLREVRALNPDAHITYKAHPDVAAGNRHGAIPTEVLAALANTVADRADIGGYLAIADEVHTLTSLTGFEALLRGKPVVTYGLPFYGGWGLTRDLARYPRPRRHISLDELTAGALMLYPLYIDPDSGLPCDAMVFVERMADLHRRGVRSSPSAADRWLRPLRALHQTFVRPPRARY